MKEVENVVLSSSPVPSETQEDIPIFADDRETGQPVLAALHKLGFAQASVGHLSLGDYQLGGQLIVERKTMKDFVASIIDGRLFEQASRLSQTAEHSCLILEGSGRDLADSGMSRESIQGALITLQLIFHLPVLRSTDPEETARMMIFAWRQLVRQEKDQVNRGGRRPKRKKRAQLLALQALPSVGPKRAELLLERFGSVRAVMNASAVELEAIPGIKAKTIQGMQWVLD